MDKGTEHCVTPFVDCVAPFAVTVTPFAGSVTPFAITERRGIARRWAVNGFSGVSIA